MEANDNDGKATDIQTVDETMLDCQKLKKQRPKNKVCGTCQKRFSREKQLQDHIRTHTG